MRKLMSLLLAVVMILSMAVPVMGAGQDVIEQESQTVAAEPAQGVATADDDDSVIDFDALLFWTSVKSVTATDVVYYTYEGHKEPVFTVTYNDDTTGPIPEGITVTYPDGWPTTPGIHVVRALVGGKELSFQATVLESSVSGELGSTVSWVYDSSTKTMTLFGTGVAVAADADAWSELYLNLLPQHVVVEEGITELFPGIFCYSPHLLTISLPTTLREIPLAMVGYNGPMSGTPLEEQFGNADGMQSVVIPEGITSLKNHAFYMTWGITEIYLPASLQEIDPDVICSIVEMREYLGLSPVQITIHFAGTQAQWENVDLVVGDTRQQYGSGWSDAQINAVFDSFNFVFEAENTDPDDPVVDPDDPDGPVIDPDEPIGPETNLAAPVVRIEKDYAGRNMLAWDAVEYADMYEIWRATSKTGTYELVDAVEWEGWLDDNIPVGKTYYYKVVAVYLADTELNSAFSNVESLFGTCARPELEVNFNESTGKPVLSWNKISGAKKYEIWYAVGDGAYKKLTTTTKTSYTHTGASAGKYYSYKIKALGSSSSQASVFSNSGETYCYMSRTTLTASVDAATGKPSLSWKKVSGAKSYAIGRCEADGEHQFELIAQVKTLKYLDTEAQFGTEYIYTIVAIGSNDSIYSFMSAQKNVTCTLARPSLKTEAMENGKPRIYWTPVDGAVVYEIYRSTKSTKSYVYVATVEDAAYVDESVAAGKTFYYKVVAVGEKVESAQSSYIKAVGKCDAPVLSVEAGATGKPVLTWNKVTGAKKYEIYRSINGGTFKKLTTTTKTTYTDTKATEGALCVYKVRALGSSSSYNGNFGEAQGCNVICAAPSLTIKIDTTTGKPSLSWSKVTGATGYEIYRSVNEGEFTLLTTVEGTSYKDTDTKADNRYAYKMVTLGKSVEFNSVETVAKTVTVAVGQPKLAGSIDAEGKVVITWGAVDDAVAYKVYRSTKSSSGYIEVATIAELTYTDTAVTAGKTYYYKVMAVGANSNSPQSAYVKLTGKCAQPDADVSLDIKSGKPVITWEKVSGAKKYEVYRATSENGKYSKIGTSTKTSYTDTKAAVGTTYYYKVVAAGSKSSYNSIQSEATEAVTALMAQPSVTVKNDSKTGKPVVSWGKVSGATQYVVMYVDVTDFMESEEGPDEAYIEANMQPLETTKTSVTLSDAVLGHVYMVTVTAVPKNEEYFSVPTDPQYVAATCVAPKITGRIDTQSGKPSATWNEVEGAECYFVYRSTKSGSGYTYIGYVEDTGFIDGSAVKGKTYYYKVTAVAGYSESAMSNSTKLKSK